MLRNSFIIFSLFAPFVVNSIFKHQESGFSAPDYIETSKIKSSYFSDQLKIKSSGIIRPKMKLELSFQEQLHNYLNLEFSHSYYSQDSVDWRFLHEKWLNRIQENLVERGQTETKAQEKIIKFLKLKRDISNKNAQAYNDYDETLTKYIDISDEYGKSDRKTKDYKAKLDNSYKNITTRNKQYTHEVMKFWGHDLKKIQKLTDQFNKEINSEYRDLNYEIGISL